VPDAGGGEPFRFVVDETSFDFRNLTEEQLTEYLDDFSDGLAELRGLHRVAVSSWWTETECAEGRELYEVLYEGGTPRAGRDARLRMAGLMDRCPTWDTALPGLPDRVEVAGRARELAWSVGYAWWHAGRGHHVACLVFPAARMCNWLPVTAADGSAGRETEREVFFLTEPPAVTGFWRDLFAREDVAEADFLGRAKEAFPGLVFADSLSFRKFDGTYREMRDWVVQVLSVVQDHFADALAKHVGKPADVQAELGHHGLVLSPESPRTRSKSKIMRQRDVEYDRQTYHCEWHAKKEPHRNRVHFSLPDQRLGGRILIGIFVDHLDTE